MLAALDGFLSDTRAKRLDKELRVVLSARFELLEDAIRAHYVTLPRTAKMNCRPTYVDFAFTPECRTIVDVPVSETVALEQFTLVVPALAQKWDADRRRELTAYLRPYLGEIAPDVDPLSLAIAVFKVKPEITCFVGIGLLRYPNVFTHDCRFQTCFRGACITSEAFHEQDTYTRTVQSLEWSWHQFKHLEKSPHLDVDIATPFHLDGLAGRVGAFSAVSSMRRIVSALGLDPARATFDDLERHDVWLRCVTCETDRPNDCIWAISWRDAVSLITNATRLTRSAYTPTSFCYSTNMTWGM